MKCATTTLHRYLDLHPDVAISDPKELNFFCGPGRLDGHRDDRTAQVKVSNELRDKLARALRKDRPR